MRIAEFVVFYIALGGTKMISSGYTISKPGKCSDIKYSYSYTNRVKRMSRLILVISPKVCDWPENH